jgi:hypothetical protein
LSLNDFDPPRPKICTHCHTPIWEIHNLGIGGRLDTQPIDLATELSFRIKSRPSYAINHTTGGLHAELRIAATIKQPNRRHVTVPAHDCQQPHTHPDGHPDYFNLNRKPNPDMTKVPF